jgi:hypothetical protein
MLRNKTTNGSVKNIHLMINANGALYCQKEWLAMGAPSSVMPSENSLQHTESICRNTYRK